MTKAISVDLRSRVLAAVEAGASHRQAAERFDVSAASVSRWRTQAKRHGGKAQPGRQGGDRRSHHIEAQKDLILSLLAEAPDITIAEMRQTLGDRGHRFGFGTIQRFFVRHRLTRKKRRPTRPNRTGPIS